MSQFTEASQTTPSSLARFYARLDQRDAFSPRETPQPRQPVLREPSAPRAPAPSRDTRVSTVSEAPRTTSVGELLEFDLGFLAQWLRAGIKWIMVLAVVGAAAGLMFGILVKPRFTATASIVVEPANMQVMNDNLFPSYTQGEAQLAAAESRLQILTSGNVLMRTVEELNLAADPDFVPPAPAFSLGDLFGSADGPARPPELTAMQTLGTRVAAKRVDKSFVVALSAASDDPDKSVTIVNSLVNSFQHELAASDTSSANRASASMEGRLDTMRQDLNVAEEAVETFKQRNNLQSSQGELVNAQSLTQINAQRNQAEVSLAQAQSRLDELRGASGEARITTQSLQSATVTALRQQYATLKQQLDSEAVRFGPRHPTIQSLSAQVAAISVEINAEAQRLVEATQAEVAEANALVASLDRQADGVRASLSSDNSAQIALRALERDALAKASIYEAFLSRVGELSEREQIDATNVRIISQATPPIARSYPPRTVLLIMLGAVGGIMVGCALALALGWRRNARAERYARG